MKGDNEKKQKGRKKKESVAMIGTHEEKSHGN
jgi:hypothetical protein